MEVNWVLIAAAVLVVGLVLMNMQKSRFDDYGVTGDEYAPVDTYDDFGVTGDEYAPVDTYAEDDEAEYDEAEAEADDMADEYEAEDDDMAADESADEESDGETEEVEEFTLMEPTIDDKYANALFTPPLL